MERVVREGLLERVTSKSSVLLGPDLRRNEGWQAICTEVYSVILPAKDTHGK